MIKNPSNKISRKWLLITGAVLLLTGLSAYFYFATVTYDDTAKVKADFNKEAFSFIKEFETDYKSANKKYAEKIIAVSGTVTSTEAADTTVNIKMADTVTGSYLIFAFQSQHLNQAKKLKTGDHITIKGSCSGGVFSNILKAYFISFKRSVLDK